MCCCSRRQFADGTQIEMCDFKMARRHYLAYYMADLFIFYIIPLFLTCLLYALIARILVLSTRPSGTSGTTAAAATAPTRAGTESAAARMRRSTSSTSSRVQASSQAVT